VLLDYHERASPSSFDTGFSYTHTQSTRFQQGDHEIHNNDAEIPILINDETVPSPSATRNEREGPVSVGRSAPTFRRESSRQEFEQYYGPEVMDTEWDHRPYQDPIQKLENSEVDPVAVSSFCTGLAA
jgi:hypothetical protein